MTCFIWNLETSVTEGSEGDLFCISVEKKLAFLGWKKLILNDKSGVNSAIKFIGVAFSGGTF